MEQSTKLFLVLGFMFILYTTMNGHLERYLQVVFGSSSKSPSAGKVALNAAKTGAKIAAIL